ncbi:segregation and condensation protein A [Phosphitispora sp. TUW77]|uniref:segregation and condensation protein A n=1 Tax=Phosphitispora sp. TUW77 TaxID=3152361 RepID=UPI003AB3B029
MAYQIKLGVFEGPFDLLFHLLEKNEVDIYDIPIAKITAQYLEYISAMQMMDLEVASEFLVMAANLLAIKARMLLPKPPVNDEEAQEEYDPRDELVEKLLEYKKFKVMVEFFQEKETLMNRVYTRPNEEDMFYHLFKEENPLEGINMSTLLEALQEALERAVDRELTGEIQRDEVTTRDKMKEIMRRLFFQNRGIAFKDLFHPRVTRVEVVVTFLALLELIKLGRIRAYQSRTFGEIMIYSRDNDTAGA